MPPLDPHQQPVAGTVYAPDGAALPADPARAALARRVIRDALFLGVSASALLHEGPGGIGVPIWVALLLASLVALVWRAEGRIGREPGAWLAGALLFATLHGLDDGGFLAFLDVVATLGCLIMVGVAITGMPVPGLLAARVRDLAASGLRAVRHATTWAVPLVLRDADWSGVGRALSSRGGGASVRAVLLTLPLVIVFGALLRSADPMFASLVALPTIDAEMVLSYLLIGGVFAWISAGWLRGVIVEPETPRLERPLRLPALGAIEIGTALGAVSLLFATFVLVQLRWMFGGEAVVRATTGLGFAEYARRGFFELVWVALLTLPLLLGIDGLTPRTDTRARGRFRLLGRVLLVLLAAVVASALGRMGLYVRYYGLSIDRLYATAFMVWIAIVLAWLAATVLRDRARPFAAGMVVSALLVLAALHALRPDAFVARHNLARGPLAVATATGAVRERPVDLDYLASLGASAVPVVVSAVLRAPTQTPAQVRMRCDAAQTLLESWGSDDWLAARHPERIERRARAYDWRLWNPSRQSARATVRTNEAALQRSCVTARGEFRGDRWIATQ